MKLESVRSWQIMHMENAIKSFDNLIKNASHDDLTVYRDSGEGWSVVAVLCHLRDFEEIFLQRAKLTVEQDKPDLPFPKPDDLAAERKYFEQDPQIVLDEWQAHRTLSIAYFGEREESDWERAAIHPMRGEFTLHDQFFLVSHHDMLHMEQATRILLEKRP
ncbi:MAG: DinB family protein [Anaerolineae bacterium]|nr:DinB family protein [Anaerolineae bacterium]MDQ7035284.1 DinB family protein [Anaerolineae bacterium]